MSNTPPPAGAKVRRPRRPGSQTALRQLNRDRIVGALAANGPLTQADLSRRTGLSAATVSNIVRLMIEDGAAAAEQITSSGRRAAAIRLLSDGEVVVGIDFGRRHARVVVVNPGYEVLGEAAIELPLGYPAMEGVDAAARVLRELLAHEHLENATVLGIGLGIPGPIDRRTSTVVQGTILPEWLGVTREDLEIRLGHPVLLDNDANLGALAEVTWGAHSAVDNLLFVKIGSGIGSGLIIDGRPYYGHTGVTGEIGHMAIDDYGAVCHCGNRGCLETVASTTVMMGLLSRSSPGLVTTGDIVQRALEGDAGTLRVLDDAGAAIGKALGSVANFVNPAVIVIGGPLADVGPVITEPIARSMRRHAIPLVGEATIVTTSSLGARAEALGGASLALRHARAAAPA
ncbi:ROK family transcriptional regulator [Homoserinibacter sp. YIM 151385]|uniref:ROK family transcriptional regulator n=1 Tax=Homoserinibacter sp. YIM 151385 TaxID=2985506 RepID=UPI0022F0EADE|nr:ROK family transcriptional regulator [Homoserinibacter sp. YIM 151385]WBU36920.1 ROK family transcriptional regulator [Homoserinibacter sp. YIM 151385]